MDTAPALRLAALFEAGRTGLTARYGKRMQTHQLRAMNAILACRTGALGHVLWRCPEPCSPSSSPHPPDFVFFSTKPQYIQQLRLRICAESVVSRVSCVTMD